VIERYLKTAVKSDALDSGKMALITGPRQVGKSTLAKSLVGSKNNYFVYDNEKFRRAWAKSPEDAISGREPGPIVLDEIHKDRRWKPKVKGLYDTKALEMIVTGSARFDHYRRGSDSLLGRYLPYRLHPFTVAESGHPPGPDKIWNFRDPTFPWADLLALGGFPENRCSRAKPTWQSAGVVCASTGWFLKIPAILETSRI